MMVRKSYLRLSGVLAGLSLVWSLAACGKKTTTDAATTATGSGNGQTFLSTDFFVNVLPPDGVTMYSHAYGDGNWTTPCKISQGTKGQMLYCVIEADELDLWMHGVNIAFNFPNGMCRYSSKRKFFYYESEPGSGPSVIRVDVGLPGTDQASNDGNIQPDTMTCNGEDPDSKVPNPTTSTLPTPFASYYPANTSCATKASMNLNGKLTCAYDYSGYKPPGPNCCEGTYKLYKKVWIHPSPSPSASVSPLPTFKWDQSESDWGGAAANCLKGPAMDDGSGKDTSGYPDWTIKYIWGQPYNDSDKIMQPVLAFGNTYYANYFDQSVDGLTGVISASTSPTPFVQPYFEYECLDRAAEHINVIRVLVRSWSKDSEFLAKGNPYLTGNEPAPFDQGHMSGFCDRPDWYVPSGYVPWNSSSSPKACGYGNNYPWYHNNFVSY